MAEEKHPQGSGKPDIDEPVAESQRRIDEAKAAAADLTAPDADPFPESEPPRDQPGTPA